MEAVEVEAFRSRVGAQMTQLLGSFPAKVAELEALLQDPVFAMGPEELRAPLDIPLPDPAQKKKKKEKDEEEEAPPCPPIPSHPALMALLERWRPLLAEARNHVAQVALWLQLQVPRIEDGDNFGVAVQEKVLELLTASRTQLEGLQGRLPKYLSERGDAVSKAAKNPHVLDYRALVHALDAAELGATRLALAELRDLYAVLLDVLQKNMEKLRKPRGEPKAMIF
ncbi:proteasome activator complex subunit 1 isoform X1 [Aythya fuligula]|uniref:Proteasome activator complex subunit 1 n=1 Tax=Aythya fuligula TaxID=219594 RepID=A0A6J3EMH8_AYTFU|nr:proteasome activator complex subunit 1 isoform X1 [Aythya fuligula]